MRVQITDSQYNKILNESIEQYIDEDYPLSWDVEKFKTLSSFKQRINYCENNLVRISSGTSRIVYKIDDEKVLKLAKNKKGLAQNEIEQTYSKYYDLKSIVAEVYNYDENNLWVEMELARKITPKSFFNIVGVSFVDYCYGMKFHEGDNKNHYSKPDNMEELWDNEFIYEMLSLMAGYDIPSGDLCKLSSFGLVKRNGVDDIVMIDYGLTNDIYQSYYT